MSGVLNKKGLYLAWDGGSVCIIKGILVSVDGKRQNITNIRSIPYLVVNLWLFQRVFMCLGMDMMSNSRDGDPDYSNVDVISVWRIMVMVNVVSDCKWSLFESWQKGTIAVSHWMFIPNKGSDKMFVLRQYRVLSEVVCKCRLRSWKNLLSRSKGSIHNSWKSKPDHEGQWEECQVEDCWLCRRNHFMYSWIQWWKRFLGNLLLKFIGNLRSRVISVLTTYNVWLLLKWHHDCN